MEYDNWRIRKYVEVEPAATVVKHFGKPATNLPLVEPTALTTSFQYDGYNKLTEITHPDSTTETLSYDANGQLVKSEKSTGETTNFEKILKIMEISLLKCDISSSRLNKG